MVAVRDLLVKSHAHPAAIPVAGVAGILTPEPRDICAVFAIRRLIAAHTVRAVFRMHRAEHIVVRNFAVPVPVVHRKLLLRHRDASLIRDRHIDAPQAVIVSVRCQNEGIRRLRHAIFRRRGDTDDIRARYTTSEVDAVGIITRTVIARRRVVARTKRYAQRAALRRLEPDARFLRPQLRIVEHNCCFTDRSRRRCACRFLVAVGHNIGNRRVRAERLDRDGRRVRHIPRRLPVQGRRHLAAVIGYLLALDFHRNFRNIAARRRIFDGRPAFFI